MFKSKISMFLTILIVLFTCTYAYGVTYYSGIPFSNSASDGDIATWTNSGKWEWVGGATFLTLIGATPSSTHGTSLNADDLELNGAVLQTAAEIPHIDAAQTWSAHQTMASTRRSILTSAPTDPILLDEYTVKTPYDPSGSGLSVSNKVVLTRNTTELFDDSENQDFTAGGGDWTNVDIGTTFDETTDLSLASDAAGQYCTLAVAEAPTTVGKRYRLPYKLTNLTGSWIIQDFTGAQTIGTITENAAAGYLDWTATTTGGFRIVSGAEVSIGDFDDFSLNLLPYILLMDENGTQYANGISSRTPVTGHAADFATEFIGADLYGGTFVCSEAGTIQLPLMEVGMNFSVITLGALAVVIDTNVADGYLHNGVTGAEGKNLTNLSTAGDIAVIEYYTADDWLITTNGWTAE